MICKAWTEGDAHIRSLANQYGLCIKPPIEVSDWYLMVRGELIPHTGFAAEPETNSILIKEIENEEEYWSALHEIGHCVDQRARSVFMTQARHAVFMGMYGFAHDALMDIEAAAWEWAIKNSIYELSSNVVRRIALCLQNYNDAKPYYANRKHKIESDLLWSVLNY